MKPFHMMWGEEIQYKLGIENMNLVKMVNETFHMIWGGEKYTV